MINTQHRGRERAWAICKVCNARIKTRGRISPILKHLLVVHGVTEDQVFPPKKVEAPKAEKAPDAP